MGITKSFTADDATSKPSTALSTEMAGVIRPSPYSSAVPKTPSMTSAAVRRPPGVFGMTSAVSARMPPSPRLSARMMKVMYLMEMMITSAQNATDASPSAFVSLTVRSW